MQSSIDWSRKVLWSSIASGYTLDPFISSFCSTRMSLLRLMDISKMAVPKRNKNGAALNNLRRLSFPCFPHINVGKQAVSTDLKRLAGTFRWQGPSWHQGPQKGSCPWEKCPRENCLSVIVLKRGASFDKGPPQNALWRILRISEGENELTFSTCPVFCWCNGRNSGRCGNGI